VDRYKLEARMADSELGIETDKAGVSLKIKYCPIIGGTDCMTFYLRNFIQLVDSGFAGPSLNGHNRCRAVYATLNDQIVGQITFEILDDFSKTTWIRLSAVDENFRKRGIYDILHKYLEQLMPQLGSRKLASYVHVNNLVRQASCKKVGMSPIYIRMEKSI
jgi:Acetyltransferase (GNAT) family